MGISFRHKTQLSLVFIDGNLNVVRYRDEALAPVAVSFVFQQDNARPHVARVCREYLDQNNDQTLDWPAFSPDLRPIEHIWDILNHRVRRRDPQPTTVQRMTQAIVEEWDRLTQPEIQHFINSISMRRRIHAGCV